MTIRVFMLCPSRGVWNDVYITENPTAVKGIKFKFHCPKCDAEHELIVNGYERVRTVPPKAVLANRQD